MKDVERKETKTRAEGAGVGRLEHKLIQKKKSRRKLRVVGSYFYFIIKYGNIVNKSLMNIFTLMFLMRCYSLSPF